MSYEAYCEDVECGFYTWSEPVARKEHKCLECGAPIKPGEKYFYFRGVWEGEFSSGRQHLVCLEACMFIRDHVRGGECIPFGDLIPAGREYAADGPVPLRRLLAKILWRARRGLNANWKMAAT